MLPRLANSPQSQVYTLGESGMVYPGGFATMGRVRRLTRWCRTSFFLFAAEPGGALVREGRVSGRSEAVS
jgi:hypothetical protein